MGEFTRKPTVPKPAKCRICLADESVVVVGTDPNRRTESTLDRGVCRDRAACESRQPPLFRL